MPLGFDAALAALALLGSPEALLPPPLHAASNTVSDTANNTRARKPCCRGDLFMPVWGNLLSVGAIFVS
jgi:hypothetical protein